jgi:hypothetical protein
MTRALYPLLWLSDLSPATGTPLSSQLKPTDYVEHVCVETVHLQLLQELE